MFYGVVTNLDLQDTAGRFDTYMSSYGDGCSNT